MSFVELLSVNSLGRKECGITLLLLVKEIRGGVTLEIDSLPSTEHDNKKTLRDKLK